MGLFKKKIFKLIDEGDLSEIEAYLCETPEELEAFTTVTDKYENKRKNITPFLYAVYKNKHDTVSLLIESGANVHAVSPICKYNALHLAAWYSDIKMVEILLETDIDRRARAQYSSYPEQCTSNKEVQLLINPDYIKNKLSDNKACTFIKESDTMVSYIDVAEATETKITTYYNFADRTIVKQMKDKDGQSCCMMSFNQAANPKQLESAAKFLTQEKGDVHGFQLTPIK